MSAVSGETIDPREFRNCCGQFATGITVVATRTDDIIHGMTVNGFMSVSLEPPLIVISLDHKTRLHELLPKSKRYGVSVLSETQLQYSNHFAGRPDESLEIPFIEKASAPLLDGALAHLVARVVDMHEAGDHTLYIGQVEYLHFRKGQPLLYHAGRYRYLKPESTDHMMRHDNEMYFFPISVGS
jgi:flavin reductase (DIM6/NTAB) family NADH-FMN oxidoreductase RutF